MPGLHTAGLFVLLIRHYIADSGPFQVILNVAGTVVGEWLTFAALASRLHSDLITVNLLTTIPTLLPGTLLAHPLWEWAANWGIGPCPGSQEKLA